MLQYIIKEWSNTNQMYLSLSNLTLIYVYFLTQLTRWSEIDEVVNRLYKIPQRWITPKMIEVRRRVASAPSSGCASVTSHLQPQDHVSSPATCETNVKVYGYKKRDHGHAKRIPTSRLDQRPYSNEETTSSNVLIKNNSEKSSKSIKFQDFRTRSVSNEVYERNMSNRVLQSRPNQAPNLADDVVKSTGYSGQRCKSACVSRSSSRQGKHVAKELRERSQSLGHKPSKKVNNTGLASYDDRNLGIGDKPSIVPGNIEELRQKIRNSRRRSLTSSSTSLSCDVITPRDHQWEFNEADSDSVLSSVMDLLQTISSNNGRIRPSSAMISYRGMQQANNAIP